MRYSEPCGRGFFATLRLGPPIVAAFSGRGAGDGCPPAPPYKPLPLLHVVTR